MAGKGRIKIEAVKITSKDKVKIKTSSKKIKKGDNLKKKTEILSGTCPLCHKEFKRLDMHVCKPEEKKEIKEVKKITTPADKLLELINKGEKSINELSAELKVPGKKVEEWAIDLQEQGLVEVKYPATLILSPRIKPLIDFKREEYTESTGKEITSYEILSDNVPTKVRILDKGTKVPTYELIPPLVSAGTQAIINQLMKKVSEEVDVTSEELLDPSMMRILKDKFLNKAIEKVNQKMPDLNDEMKAIIAGIMIHKMYGLKEIELLMSDEMLEEVTINGHKVPVSVYHKTIGWCITNLKMNDEEEILNFASSIGRKVGKTISIMNPLLDAHLLSGDRVQATLFPISYQGNTITIRKFARNPWTVTQYVKNKTIDSEIAALLWISMQYELSIMVVGGTASGKTSCLNSLTALLPPNQRIISIEDVRELILPESLNWNWVPLVVRESRSEGAGDISMLNLMISSLRMRPDRIIVGEVRTKRQAEVLFEAIHTGHSVYTTLHADNAEQAYIRMVEDPISIPKSQLEGMHLIAVMFRDRRSGFRRLFQIAEIVPIPGDVGERNIKIKLLYRWTPKNDSWEKIEESERVINEIATHTGMSEEEIIKDIKDKKMILDWMVKHDILNMNDFGKVIEAYYRNPETVIKFAKENKNPGALP